MDLPETSESLATARPLTVCSLMTMLSGFSQVSLEQNVPMPKATLTRPWK